jgi:tetratricopeptide (TPR) repeat protein
MNARVIWSLVATSVVALVAWPAFMRAGAASSQMPAPAWTAAPVVADYANRDALVSTYEQDATRNPRDQIIATMLAGQYLQRYREQADVGDLLRAENEAQRSLRLQPRYNINADMTMASALTAFHQMRPALAYAEEASRIVPSSFTARATIANLDMELGDYASARDELTSRPSDDDPNWDISLARYDELTGRLASARTIIDAVQRRMDEVVDDPAETRAWTHWRQGELALTAGDTRGAIARYTEALVIFPGYWHGYDGLAKAYWALGDWRDSLEYAKKGADIYPLPEVLGYEYDAQVALGRRADAAQTLDLIYAIDRIGNAQGMNDRLIAMFYADHGLRADDAVTIARRDLARRDDIYAEDTLAWTLAADGRWQEARVHAARAVRLGTQDARLQYHAGIIALHCGDRDEARRRLQFALSLNPRFNPLQADDATAELAKLET